MLTAVFSLLSSLGLQTWLVFLLVFLLTYSYLSKQPWRRLPPGPLALPVIGSVLSLGKDMRQALARLAQQYGDIFTVYLGSRRVVVLRGYDTIKEAFSKRGHDFADRPDLFFIKHLTEGWGVVSSNGQFWKDERRHSLHILRDLGLSKALMEDRILKEVQRFINELRKNTNQPYSPTSLLQRSICCIIWSVGIGEVRSYHDPEFVRYMEDMEYSFKILGNAGLLNTFPILRHCPGDLFGYQTLLEIKKRSYGWYQAAFQRTSAITENTESFVHGYKKLLSNPDNSSSSERQLVAIMGDLVGAGTETTATTLEWVMIYMILHPEIQDKVRAEIDDVIKTGEYPTMADKSQLPYTEATLMEIQRIGNIVPLGVPHAATKDVTFKGYSIPKGTMVMADMWSVLRDPKLWPDPDKFDPTRFLDASGNVVHHEELIPFSIGKRLCLGEGLARMELFLYFVSIMKYFHLKASERGLPSLKGILGATYHPQPFWITLEENIG